MRRPRDGIATVAGVRRSLTRWGVLVAGGLALSALPVAPAAAARNRVQALPHVADGKLGEWRGTATNLAGRSQISRGESIYTDFLYDDYGPDSDGVPNSPSFSGHEAVTAGDYRYPADEARYGYNAADLRELRFSADTRALHLLVGLETMKVPDAAIVEIAIDTDGNPATGAPAWADGAGLAGGGADRFITLWGTGGRVTDAQGNVTPITQATNLTENAIEADVPLSALGPVAAGARWWAATGLAAPAGTFVAQDAGKPAAFDVAMPGDDDWPLLTDHWGDHRQAEQLAKGTIEPFGQPLDLDALQKRRSRPFRIVPGFYNAIYKSKLDLGEGIDLKKDSPPGSAGLAAYPRAAFLSQWQPYALSIPPGYLKGKLNPLLIYGHPQGFGQNLFRTVSPNSLTQIGDGRDSLVLTPLARGTDSWYLDTSLVDVLDAWKDVKRRFRVDPDHTTLGGYSMGGFLSYRLGLLMPDQFARVALYVGPPAYFHWAAPAAPDTIPEWQVAGNTNLIVDNGLNLPYEVSGGNADELVPISGVLAQIDSFRKAGNPYRFYHHSNDEHFSFILSDSIGARTAAWLGNGQRDRAPVEVRFKRYPRFDLPKYGLTFDGAYWVDGLVVRDSSREDSFGEIDAINFARGGHLRKVVSDLPGVSVGESGTSPANVTGQHLEDGEPVVQRNGFQADLVNISQVTFKARAMGLDPSTPVQASLTGDGTTTVRLDGRWTRRTSATVDGLPATLYRSSNRIQIVANLSGSGPHQLVITPGPARSARHRR